MPIPQSVPWLEVATGQTVHSRHPSEFVGASATIDSVFRVVARLVDGEPHASPRGQLPTGQPSRRTAQRWRAGLLTKAQEWMHCIRLALINRLVPRPLEELFPLNGVPPPTPLRARSDVPFRHLRDALWLLFEGARRSNLSVHTLLVAARRDLMNAPHC
ncbi:MAG: hypothetical protein GY772_01370 [bacterium]|nr:hypothetical protein [bacterium]